MGLSERFSLRSWSSLGVVVICILMLVFAVPRLVSSFYALYPETLLKQNKPVSEELYFKAIEDLESALSWHDDPRYWQSLGLCYVYVYNQSVLSKSDKRWLLDKAIPAIVNGLKASPIDPFAWFRLAVALELADEPFEKIQSAYRLSLYSGRVEPELIINRVKFGYIHFSEFDIELREMWLKQIELAYQFRFQELVDLAVEVPDFKPFVETVLLFDQDKLQKFNKSFEINTQQSLKAKRKH